MTIFTSNTNQHVHCIDRLRMPSPRCICSRNVHEALIFENNVELHVHVIGRSINDVLQLMSVCVWCLCLGLSLCVVPPSHVVWTHARHVLNGVSAHGTVLIDGVPSSQTSETEGRVGAGETHGVGGGRQTDAALDDARRASGGGGAGGEQASSVAAVTAAVEGAIGRGRL